MIVARASEKFVGKITVLIRGRRTAACALVVTVVFAGLLAHAEPSRRSLTLELEDVPGVAGYEIRMTKILDDGSKKTPAIFKIKGTAWSAKLLPGKYSMEVRSLDSREVPGEWSPAQDMVVKLQAAELTAPTANSQIHSEDDKFEKVTFSWKPVEGADRYKLKIAKADGTLIQDSEEKETSIKVKLPVAADYQWTVTAVMGANLDGDSTSRNFEVIGVRLGAPKLRAVDDINTTVIDWKPVENATQYKIRIEQKNKDGEYRLVDEKIVKDPKYVMKKPLPSGQYRYVVQALGEKRDPSREADDKFKTLYVNARSPAAINQVKEEASYDTKTNLFALASYFITFVNYSGYDARAARPVGFDAIGGTGRLGVGRWFSEESPWGLLATADLSGYTISGQTFTYVAGAAQAVYRYRLGALGQLRFSGGLQYRDLPVTVVTPTPLDPKHTDQKTLSTMGPMVGATLLHGLTRKIGVQVNAFVSHSSFGTSAPEGTNDSKISYQLGLLGSLNMAPGLVGFAGYSYRAESGGYTGSLGSSTAGITGHYVNLLMEYGF